ncbi:MAG TPA: protein-S-isoprenylcysteine O-methyltransferase [Anaerolineaceae bacterium]|nr:protein-S-isoprenylcysteine O-methyltransferase [Anaerolineaceae bacterium]HPN51210.1 protein-S-isoprenylcysteine O-methyltransferase [Anaerolineaceae bacterium]
MSDILKYIYLAGMLIQEGIRYPHRLRQRKAWREGGMVETRMNALDFTIDMVAFAGMDLIPLMYILTPWLDYASYPLDAWRGVLGTLLLIGATVILFMAHQELAANWSPTLQIGKSHKLITTGIYHYLRHPIYAAVWLTGLAQWLMLGNWVAGPACLIFFLPVYLRRVPREEQMMIDTFGDQYRDYMETTGGILPRFGK